MEIVLILDNIRSAENVGSILRTADAAGVREVFLVGITPSPIDRFGRVRKDIQKTALGAEKSVVWHSSKTIQEVALSLKAKNYHIYALEQSQKSVPYTSISFTKEGKCALIVGNETEGVSTEALTFADACVEIPMYGKKESLNVSVATGIALYAIRERAT